MSVESLNPSSKSRPRLSKPIVPATVTMLTLATIATRRPAAITGTAIGSSTRKNRPSGL